MKFFSFARDRGVKFFEPPNSLIEPRPLGRICAYNLVPQARRQEALERHIRDYYWHRRMMNGFRLKTSLVQIDDANFRKSSLACGKRVILNGVSGDRQRNEFRRKVSDPAAVLQFFKEYWSEHMDPDNVEIANECIGSDIYIEAKNYFNFYHFLAESLHQAYCSSPTHIKIKNVNFFSKSNQQKKFIEDWAGEAGAAIGRTAKVHQKEKLDLPTSVLAPISAKHMLYQFSGRHHQQIADARPPGHSWTGFDAQPHGLKIIGMNCCDDTMLDFRNAMLKEAGLKVSRVWSENIYVRRSPSLVRRRDMIGEDELIRRLSDLNFEVVYFEDLPVLEQVKCISGAKRVVMQHGAGMANMLFASADAHVFEIGTYQTAMSRWADFMQLCHASGCHYHNIFADMDFEEEDRDPVFADDGLVPPKLNNATINTIVDLIEFQSREDISGSLAGMLEHSQIFIDRTAYKQCHRLIAANENFFRKDHRFILQTAKLEEAKGDYAEAYKKYAKALNCGGKADAAAGLKRMEERISAQT